MKSNIFKFFIFFVFCFSALAQDKYLKVPTIFNKKQYPKVLNQFYTGQKDLSQEKYLKGNSANDWIVYSDREDNLIYRYPGGNVIMENGEELTVDAFVGFYVKQVKYHNKKNYLLVEKQLDTKISGWIPAENLILSQHCALTEVGINEVTSVPVPKKAIILVSLSQLKGKISMGQIKDLDELISKKRVYKTPSPRKSQLGERLQKFEILFVYKKFKDGMYLLGRTDKMGGKSDKTSAFLGWVEPWAITDWSTRICFEQFDNTKLYDIDLIKGRPGLLPGYEDENDLITGLNTGIFPHYIDKENPKNNKSYLISFRAEPMSHNRMRMPILGVGTLWKSKSDINDKRQIYNVVSIAKDNTKDDTNTQILYDEKIDMLTKLHKDVNIIFAIDATGSMAPYASAVAKSLSEIDKLNESANNANLKFGFIFYRDYQDGGPENGQKLSLTSNNRKKVALEYLPLTRVKGSAIDHFQTIINSTPFGSKPDRNPKTNQPEAVYNGLINGVKQIFESGGNKNKYKSQSNVVVLIGDCGNYDSGVDKKGYTIEDVEKVFNEYKINLITFQVDYQSERPYRKFNFDGKKLGEGVGKSWIKGKESLKLETKFEEDAENNDTRKLEIFSSKSSVTTGNQSENFTPVFSTFTFTDKDPFSPDELKGLIEKSFKNYMKSLITNINALSDALTRGVEGQEPSPLLIAQIMEIFNISEQEAKEFLMRQEITVEAKLVEKYGNPGHQALTRVAFLTDTELDDLVDNLDVNMDDNNLKGTKRFQEFQNGIISMVETVIGSKGIEGLTMDEAWRIVFGAPFNNSNFKDLKDVKLSELETQKKQKKKKLEEFITYFYVKTNTFLEKQKRYSSGSNFKKRKFEILGVPGEFFWVPLSDLPGTTDN